MVKQLVDGFFSQYQNWITYAIAGLLFLFAVSASHNMFRPDGENPLQITNSEIVNHTIVQGDPLVLKYNTVITRQHCDVYVERNVSIQVNGSTVWNAVSPVHKDIVVAGGVGQSIIPIPTLPTGEYFYKATVHLVCGVDSFTASTPLLPFTITAKKSS